MVNIVFVFYLLVFIFAVIGSIRGWAKELLVSASVILALALIAVMQDYIPVIKTIMLNAPQKTQFYIRGLLLIFLVFFGYQSPNLPTFAAKSRKERFQDGLLGFFLGALNGYLIVGTLWYFLDQAQYPFENAFMITPGDPKISAILNLAAPSILAGPWTYIAVVLAFIFVIVVFL